jgi:hypothetical protein
LYIFIQLSSLNNTISTVSGVSVQVSGFWSLITGYLPKLMASDQNAETRLRGHGRYTRQ